MRKGTYGLGAVAILALGCSSEISDGLPGSGGSATPGSGSVSGSGSTLGSGGGLGPGTGGGQNPGTGGAGGGSGATTSVLTCVPGVPPTPQLPRLTNAQYDRTVSDLFGVTTLTAANNVPPSALLTPNQSGDMDSQTWTAYQNVGALVAAQVMSDPTSRAKFMTCTPSVECITTTIEQFGRKAFRRPLTQQEMDRFGKLVTDGASITENGTPEEIAQLVAYAFLISPSFLSRAEITESPDGAGHFALSSHEVAARLSFMLTGSSPDDELMTAANNDALQTSDQVLAQAQRLLETEGARKLVAEFHRSYIGADQPNSRWQQAAGTGKDPSFAGFTKELVDTFVEEETLLFDDVTFEQNGSFSTLLLTDVAFVTDSTAAFYGLSGNFGPTLTKTTVDASRPGFLTRLGFLANFADYSRGNPILRGAFITKEVIGVDPGNPNPAAAMTKLPEASADLDTNRKRVEEMTKGPGCGSCHTPFVNPPGFALESFNAVGATQTTESFSGAQIDTAVDIVVDDSMPAVHVANAAEMMQVIASSPVANQHYATKMVSVAYERAMNNADMCIAQDMGTKLVGGMSIKEALASLAATDSFRVRVVEEN